MLKNARSGSRVTTHISLRKSGHLKAIAILMMLFLHLFNRSHEGLFIPLIYVGEQPLSYYLSLFADACVPIFAFASGYGLYFKFLQDRRVYGRTNLQRLKNLYISYWIIVLLFAVGLGLMLGSASHPGSWQKFFLNVTAIDPSYNGAWWFFTIYVLFVLTSTFWFRLLDWAHVYVYFGVLLAVYLVAFYFRIYRTEVFEQPVLDWLQQYSALYFCTLLQFMLGAFALKHNWHQKVSALMGKLPWPTWWAVAGILALVAFRAAVPNFIMAPLTALGFIFLFLQLDLRAVADRTLDFLAPHATNLWLIHMFFYLIFFPDLVYGARYVLPIFAWLVALCLVSSYGVKWIEGHVKRLAYA